ncbi:MULTISPECIES: hypothetical protein [unclassified Streptomyces]|uniref:hypothetical protein n=1 Tax=unclassified Streptomyces TaxID=2593676 RepID=UPI002366185C|nr:MULTISPECIES: hypothetical protein [unclassified Streptomyces]MDF3141688.1 hypothetical protein [Streptomyces sp. T21Q-yed]WDF40953.1 hypothetical protein PBV52_31330 [Streptomyces sp. T12]
MDQEIAALIAAGFGLLGAVVGGAAAVWGAKIGAERSAHAVKQQVQDQAAAEHAHWLRQQRSEAYEQFEDAYNEVSRLVELGEEQDVSQAVELIRTLYRWQARIEILGPPAVAESAEGVLSVLGMRLAALTAMHRMNSGADGVPDEDYVRMINGLVDESQFLPDRWRDYHRDFVAAAQQVMGSHQGRPDAAASSHST